MNAFLMDKSPLSLGVYLGENVYLSMGTASLGVPLSREYIPLPLARGNVPYQMENMGSIVIPSQWVPMM